MESKIIYGVYTWDEAVALEGNGWRLPTIFELFEIHNQHKEEDNKDYWSSSPNAHNSHYTWQLHFHDGYGNHNYKGYGRYVRVVRGGQEFDHKTPVSIEEVNHFRKTGELPSWHPPIMLMKTLVLTDQEIKFLRKATSNLGMEDKDALTLQLKIANALLEDRCE